MPCILLSITMRRKHLTWEMVKSKKAIASHLNSICNKSLFFNLFKKIGGHLCSFNRLLSYSKFENTSKQMNGKTNFCRLS